MKNLKKLSRSQLKNLSGGEIINGGPRAGLEGQGGNYKCCSNNSDACSACVHINSNPVCSTGSYAVAC
ncbi:hypothetical protein IW15_16430 [Chryseobacterium soli]|uniref:Bacteriocin n=1 Tax=Chryseobacterium soli TaxID=445961 RepID=A0A086A3R8_9FLAO|nr:hypothetical protein [Chryseobacterium soli]KFF11332.1 hypothetical protein IW15_16430 [Chryseobacterium soli]